MLDLPVIRRLSPNDEPLFEQTPMVTGAKILLVYSRRVFLDSDTESEGRMETGDHAAPEATESEAMEEEGSAVPATDSSPSEMQLEKWRRRRRLQRLVRRNGGDPTNPTDSLVLAMLAAEPPIVIVSHDVDAAAILEAMYLQDEERLRTTMSQGLQNEDTALVGIPTAEVAETESGMVQMDSEKEPVRTIEVTSQQDVEGQLEPALQEPMALNEQDTSPVSVDNAGLQPEK